MKITLLAADAQHPNRLPFEGVLTYYDVPSDNPVGGASGMRVLIPSDVGIPALTTLEGMAVNVRDDFGGHNKKKKIGVIEAASAGEADETGAVPVKVRGYLYAKDFPDEVADLQAEKDDLGFSYEAEATGEIDNGLYRASSVTYTGATILYKNKAAYVRTSLAAEGDNMNEEQVKALIDAALAVANETIQALQTKVDEMATSLNAAAETETKVNDLTTALAAANEKIEALTTELAEAKTSLTASADVNLDGYVKVEQYDGLKAQADAMKTQIDELVAEAGDKAAYERKSVTFPMTLSAHYKIDEKDDLAASIAEIGKRDDLGPVEKMTLIMEAEARLRNQAK